MKNIIPMSLVICTVFTQVKPVIAHDGVVNITGSIQSNTCIVSPDSKNMIVEMGEVASKQFYQKGATSAAQSFTIHLEKCGDSASGVSVTFNGPSNSGDSRLVAIDKEEGDATGMGVAILDVNHNIIPLKTSTELYPLISGELTVALNFFAEYMADGTPVQSGLANATVTFTLHYA